ncbi:MAG: AraC family transcriptional regulator [Chitinophagaceae bacterium]|nr:MAG: AraC family transcriptional regulator [Chitinophagaceae bacterium]
MQHVEFFHRAHFEKKYRRRHARKALSYFIDFFWETDFDELFTRYPQGFTDALFPNLGYTYMINLGTPFVMQLGAERYPVKQDIFLPRQVPMLAHHTAGNRIFGIKFRVSPVVLEKTVNFSEYRASVHPLSYLIDKPLLQQVKSARSFEERVQLLSDHYGRIIERPTEAQHPVPIVTGLLKDCGEHRDFTTPIAELAAARGISARTLQRYFLATTGITGKQALQILRIRTAVELLVGHPAGLRYEDFGYYDYSHFFKHLRSFLGGAHIEIAKPHLELLRSRPIP